jgi:hypothetical protein
MDRSEAAPSFRDALDELLGRRKPGIRDRRPVPWVDHTCWPTRCAAGDPSLLDGLFLEVFDDKKNMIVE